MEFEAWPKIPRIDKLNARVTITEKLDGTNAQVAFDEEGRMFVGSRNRWLTPEGEGPKGCDNFGFAAWCRDNRAELEKLGPGRHYGEWYGRGIGRTYGLQERRFALFNTRRWGREGQVPPACCEVVPVLFDGLPPSSLHREVELWTSHVRVGGSIAVPGFMNPEGLVVYLSGSHQNFKVILDKQGPSPVEQEAA